MSALNLARSNSLFSAGIPADPHEMDTLAKFVRPILLNSYSSDNEGSLSHGRPADLLDDRPMQYSRGTRSFPDHCFEERQDQRLVNLQGLEYHFTHPWITMSASNTIRTLGGSVSDFESRSHEHHYSSC